MVETNGTHTNTSSDWIWKAEAAVLAIAAAFNVRPETLYLVGNDAALEWAKDPKWIGTVNATTNDNKSPEWDNITALNIVKEEWIEKREKVLMEGEVRWLKRMLNNLFTEYNDDDDEEGRDTIDKFQHLIWLTDEERTLRKMERHTGLSMEKLEEISKRETPKEIQHIGEVSKWDIIDLYMRWKPVLFCVKKIQHPETNWEKVKITLTKITPKNDSEDKIMKFTPKGTTSNLGEFRFTKSKINATDLSKEVMHTGKEEE